MGYGGKWAEQLRARELRAEAWTLQDIATELGVSKSSVSLWVRDVDFVPNPRRRTRRPRPSSLHVRKVAEIERLDAEGIAEVGQMTDREFLLAGAALYAGEGFKRDGQVGMANTDPALLGCSSAGFDTTSTSTGHDFGSACTCTRALISNELRSSGAISLVSREPSSARRTGRSLIRRAAPRSMCTDAQRSRTAHRHCIAVSWDSCGRYRPLLPIPG